MISEALAKKLNGKVKIIELGILISLVVATYFLADLAGSLSEIAYHFSGAELEFNITP